MSSYEGIGRHAVILGMVRPRADVAGAGIHCVHAPLFSVEAAEAWLLAHGSWTAELLPLHDRLALLAMDSMPGVLLIGGRDGTSLRLQVLPHDGHVLPGTPPVLPYAPGEAEAWPFTFLAVMEAAVVELPAWGEWAAAEAIDVGALSRHVHGGGARPRRARV